MPTIAELLGEVPVTSTFCVGNWVTGKPFFGETLPELDGESFKIISVEDLVCTCEELEAQSLWLGRIQDADAHHPHCAMRGNRTQEVTLEIGGELKVFDSQWLTLTTPPS